MNRPSSLRRTFLSVFAGTGLLVAGAVAAGTAAAGPAATVPTVPTVTTVTIPPLPPPPWPPVVTTVAPPPLPRPPVVTPPPPPLPAPTPPVPTVPRVAQVPPPAVTTPAPVGSQRVPAPPASAPAARSTSATSHSSQPSTQSKDPPPGSAGSGVWVLQTSPSSGSTARGEYPRVRLTKFRPSHQRFANRGKKRGTTVISFELSRPVQIVLVVKGPGPSCERVGRGRIAGRAGLNRLRFDGTVRKVPLKPGMYRLDARLRAGGRLLGSSYVTIIDPRSPSKRYARPDCSPAKLAASREPVSGLREVVTFTEIPAAVPRKSSEPAKPKAAVTLKQVLGERTPPEVGGVPFGVADDGGSRSFLELVVLVSVIGLLLLLASVLYVSVRRGWRFF